LVKLKEYRNKLCMRSLNFQILILQKNIREMELEEFMSNLRHQLFFEDRELDLYFPPALEALSYYASQMHDEGLKTFILNSEHYLQDKRWIDIILRWFNQSGARNNTMLNTQKKMRGISELIDNSLTSLKLISMCRL
jgi:hypothetical protein